MSAVVGKKTRPATRANLPERFWRLVDRGGINECWIWIGGRGGTPTHPYGVFRAAADEPRTSAHRIAYELGGGMIKAGYHVDHLCNNGLCMNPLHLEAVTQAENRRRQSARITHCKQGHELSGKNLYVDARGFRGCRTCRNTRPWKPPQCEEAWEKRKKRHREYMRERRGRTSPAS